MFSVHSYLAFTIEGAAFRLRPLGLGFRDKDFIVAARFTNKHQGLFGVNM